jgi:ribosomal-protein-alanine N-acetyltransferase
MYDPEMPRSRRGVIATGERIVLRMPQARDVREFLALRRDSRSFLERWEPRPPRGYGFARSGFSHLLKANRAGHSLKMFVCLRSTGEIIGAMNLNGIVRGAMQGASVGYWIARPFASKGYSTEALHLALRVAFVRMRLHRVKAAIIPNNRASVALVRKCRFRYEGLAKRFLQIDGRWRDHQRWAMTIEEWPGRRAKR